MFHFLKVLVQLVDNNIQDNLLSSVHSILKVLKPSYSVTHHQRYRRTIKRFIKIPCVHYFLISDVGNFFSQNDFYT